MLANITRNAEFPDTHGTDFESVTYSSLGLFTTRLAGHSFTPQTQVRSALPDGRKRAAAPRSAIKNMTVSSIWRAGFQDDIRKATTLQFIQFKQWSNCLMSFQIVFLLHKSPADTRSLYLHFISAVENVKALFNKETDVSAGWLLERSSRFRYPVLQSKAVYQLLTMKTHEAQMNVSATTGQISCWCR